jgi:hypothetical protein
MKRRLELLVVHSITAPGQLSLRVEDEMGNHRSLKTALAKAGFAVGDRVALIDIEDMTPMAEGMKK